MQVSTLTYSSPCGSLILGEFRGELVFCDWAPGRNAARVLSALGVSACEATTPLLRECARQLDLYFEGSLRDFNLPLRLVGTPFRRAVWQGLEGLPYGSSVSYSSYATALDLPPSHVRALASAIGTNPLSIILPCHRIIGSDGSLRGYAGGIPAKKFLLDFESRAYATYFEAQT